MDRRSQRLELRELIKERISSIEQIEVLLLLSDDPGRAFAPADVARRLASPVESTAMRLYLLSRTGFLDVEGTGKDPRYRYHPVDEATALLVDRLRALWNEQPLVLVEALALPDPDPDPDPVRSFADAFKLRKDEE